MSFLLGFFLKKRKPKGNRYDQPGKEEERKRKERKKERKKERERERKMLHFSTSKCSLTPRIVHQRYCLHRNKKMTFFLHTTKKISYSNVSNINSQLSDYRGADLLFSAFFLSLFLSLFSLFLSFLLSLSLSLSFFLSFSFCRPAVRPAIA